MSRNEIFLLADITLSPDEKVHKPIVPEFQYSEDTMITGVSFHNKTGGYVRVRVCMTHLSQAHYMAWGVETSPPQTDNIEFKLSYINTNTNLRDTVQSFGRIDTDDYTLVEWKQPPLLDDVMDLDDIHIGQLYLEDIERERQ